MADVLVADGRKGELGHRLLVVENPKVGLRNLHSLVFNAKNGGHMLNPSPDSCRPVRHSVALLFLYGALDSRPLSPSPAASGRCAHDGRCGMCSGWCRFCVRGTQ